MDAECIVDNLFHPVVARWFSNRIGQPTEIQAEAWPNIARRSHVLITAPTGSGKTLAAFLWALDRLARGHWESGVTRVLYISPLKALNNDVQRNLIRPLTEIRTGFAQENLPFPPIRVVTRSGDTPPNERRRMLRSPPEILITTPESLHLMLSSMGGRSILGHIRTVIMDEIHAVVGTKRGTLLISAVDRLVALCGEFQRIALSATIKPIETATRFIGGYTIDGAGTDPHFTPRQVAICRSTQQRLTSIQVNVPEAALLDTGTHDFWEDLTKTIKPILARHRSTIVFVNSRRLCEKLTFLINADQPRPMAYAHHGSLSKELRLEVEQRLKHGDLKAIVATASLELGIDIGSLDHVIMVQSPPSVSSAIQRIGRSGHGVGQTSQATLFATHAMDCMTAGVLARAMLDQDIEPLQPVECPLDVLAQVLVSMVGTETWHLDALYAAVRASYPFRNLRRRAFDLVIDMLAGRYEAMRIPALRPKIAVDRLDQTATARKGALLTLYTSGGVIPDRGYFKLRQLETGARVGELDEEFVWEAKKGQVFTLGTQNWRIDRITHNDVFVRPARPRTPAPPFWRAEDADRDFHLAEKIGCFLETADKRMDEPAFVDELAAQYQMRRPAARFLLEFLKRQKEKTGCPLPHRHHVLVERMPNGKGAAPVSQVAIHTFWGGRVNRPFGLALEAAWEKRYGVVPSIFPTNDAVFMLLPSDRDTEDVMSLVTSGNVAALLRERLEGSGTFGARFRECAARALLLPRRNFSQRMPLWLTRQRSQKLLDALGRFSDFPILLEAWRTCLQDDFDMAALRQVLTELNNGEIAWTEVQRLSPSPMALAGNWRQINHYMYAEDRQPGRVKTALSANLLEMVVFDPQLRPAVDAEVVDAFEAKRQRLYPGYAPVTPVELVEWVKERVLIPKEEWLRLLERATLDSGISQHELVAPIADKLIALRPTTDDGEERHLILALESADAVADSLYGDRTGCRWKTLDGISIKRSDIPRINIADKPLLNQSIMSQWLRFYGPVNLESIENRLGLSPQTLSNVMSDLLETRTIINGRLIQERQEDMLCHAENYETLLRMARNRRVPVVEPRDIGDLALAIAHFQGVTKPGGDQKDLVSELGRLTGVFLPAMLWESDVLPARLHGYAPPWLDRAMQSSALMWVGRQRQQVAFCHGDDLDLMMDGDRDKGDDGAGDTDEASAVIRRFPDNRGRYSLSDLLNDPPDTPNRALQELWAGVWAGKVTNDTAMALRQGIAQGFKPGGQPQENAPARLSMGRPRRYRRRSAGRLSAGSIGNWHLVRKPYPPESLLEMEELVKDRVRLLLDRYGILFRQLLARERPVFQWASIFRPLRLMELSGEVIAGCFFNDIAGPQFVSPNMLRLLKKRLPGDALFWINAIDPASLCGLGVDALKGQLPRRVVTTHLVYLGSRLAMASRRRGKSLDIHLPAAHQRLGDCFGLFDHLLGRKVNPLKSITVETINGEDAAGSPYLEVLAKRFDTVPEMGRVTVYGRLTT
jgi:ATP-dependent Lhr-like helicase